MRVRWPVVGRWAVVWAVLSAAGIALMAQLIRLSAESTDADAAQ